LILERSKPKVKKTVENMMKSILVNAVNPKMIPVNIIFRVLCSFTNFQYIPIDMSIISIYTPVSNPFVNEMNKSKFSIPKIVHRNRIISSSNSLKKDNRVFLSTIVNTKRIRAENRIIILGKSFFVIPTLLLTKPKIPNATVASG
jgi:hypothetical protein